ncbi:MAG: penicillin-binding protein 2 [Anaerolineae bacterium]
MSIWRRNEELEDTSADVAYRGRLFFLQLIILISISLLLFRVFWLQQVRGDDLNLQSADNRTARLLIDAPRGVIFDRHGNLLATNEPSFNVTITPAFLPTDDAERLAVFQRLSLLTGVPVTNTVEQQALIDAADPAIVRQYTELARLYGAPVGDTLDASGIIPQLPSSIQDVYDTFSFAQYLPATVRAGVTITEAYLIEQESLYLPGVRIIPEPIRRYPTGELTSHLIGFMGPLPNERWLDLGYERDDRVGLSGLEVSLEPLLAGRKGERQIITDWTGREVQQLGVTVPPVPGYNVHLTLNTELQAEAERLLLSYMEDLRNFTQPDFFTGQPVGREEIELGVVVAVDPRDGQVLAMVNIPTWDNNRFSTEIPVDYYLSLFRNDYEPFLNHAIAGQYPPGSTFKVVTVAAALQEGVVSPERRLDTPGVITVANQFAPNDPGRAQDFVCWISLAPTFSEHGSMDAVSGLAESCDIYMYKIAGGFREDNIRGLGINTLAEYSRQFGFGRVQGIELPLEAPGNIPTTQWKQVNFGEPWSTGDDYNSSIGQGFITATPLQVAQMAAVIANGGFLYRPRLVHHLTDAEGNVFVLNEDLNPVPAAEANVPISEDGEVGFVGQVIDVLDVSPEFIDVVAEGMRVTNTLDGTGTAWLFNRDEDGEPVSNWLDRFGIVSGGKSGTSEFCDNLSQRKGWCTEEKILNAEVLPTHSWFVAYAPFDEPEIAIAAFVYYGGEGSQWAGPIIRDLMAAYYGVDQYEGNAILEEELIPDSVKARRDQPVDLGPFDEEGEPLPDSEPAEGEENAN